MSERLYTLTESQIRGIVLRYNSKSDESVTIADIVATLPTTQAPVVPNFGEKHPNEIWICPEDGERVTPYYAEKYGNCIKYTLGHREESSGGSREANFAMMLKRVLYAWKRDADQGDGIMEEDAGIYAKAMAMLDFSTLRATPPPSNVNVREVVEERNRKQLFIYRCDPALHDGLMDLLSDATINDIFAALSGEVGK